MEQIENKIDDQIDTVCEEAYPMCNVVCDYSESEKENEDVSRVCTSKKVKTTTEQYAKMTAFSNGKSKIDSNSLVYL